MKITIMMLNAGVLPLSGEVTKLLDVAFDD